MYEVTGKEITIWVCYTEEKIRNSGYMTQLLNLLINKYKNKKITVDTHNQNLRHICNDLRINLFR
ncbi:GNAT family N-acetyltransferase [Citrifermentans bremense]|uniref:GNAT family N-acetyltransferase n=1 Tax=Citrifermentans bremense TaxID=60035 RepID=UPI0038517057